MPADSQDYLNKKKFFDRLLTVYGRKPALEAVSTPGVKIYKLHLAESNKPAKILDEIIQYAKQSNAEVVYHSRNELSRISKNSKQDQGIAVDLELNGFQSFEDLDLSALNQKKHVVIALDRVTNPQNVGMIIRSVCAAANTSLLIPTKGGAKLDSLVIKASAGTLFKANIVRCPSLPSALNTLRDIGFDIVGLDLSANKSLQDYKPDTGCAYVLGNETEGISKEVQGIANQLIKIPMANDVESLNVAVTASLLALRGVI